MIIEIVTVLTFIVVLGEAIISFRKSKRRKIPRLIKYPGSELIYEHNWGGRKINIQNIGGDAYDISCMDFKPQKTNHIQNKESFDFIFNINLKSVEIEFKDINGTAFRQKMLITNDPNVIFSKPERIK